MYIHVCTKKKPMTQFHAIRPGGEGFISLIERHGKKIRANQPKSHFQRDFSRASDLVRDCAFHVSSARWMPNSSLRLSTGTIFRGYIHSARFPPGFRHGTSWIASPLDVSGPGFEFPRYYEVQNGCVENTNTSLAFGPKWTVRGRGKADERLANRWR